MGKISRREFLKTASAALGVGFAASLAGCALKVTREDNPLAGYPDRDWEKIYRDHTGARERDARKSQRNREM